MTSRSLVRGAALAALAAACLAASGCESTQDKNRKLAKNGAQAFKQSGLQVGQQSKAVSVVSTGIVTDPNGTAVSVVLHNSSQRTLVNVPISIDVLDASGKSIFRNDAPGLAPTLTHAPLLEPGKDLTWVNDQVQPNGTAKSVKAVVGSEQSTLSGAPPKVSVVGGALRDDPTSGTELSGQLDNGSGVAQNKIVVFAAARAGSALVAAGRAEVPRLKAHGHYAFHVFFIGNPHRGKLELAAPPTVLK